MSEKTLQLLGLSAFGLATGFSLERIGFANFGEVHHMFTFADFRLLFTFMGSVALAMVGFFVFARGKIVTARPFHKGSIVGGVLFGAGWAITGSCPTAALIYAGIGHVPALANIAGMLVGMMVYNQLKPKYFRWSTGGCE